MATATIGYAIAAVAVAGTAYVAVETRKQAKKYQSSAGISSSRASSKQMFKDALAAKQIVLGHPVLSGPMVFACEQGTPNAAGEGEWIHIVVHLAGHPCHDVTHAWLDDDALVRQGATSSGADIEFRHTNGLGFVYLYLGEHAGVPPTLANLPDWSDNMTGRGQCFAHIRLKSDPSKWAGGIPNPKFAIQGLKLYDPRSDMTVWSDNPALMVRWFRNELKQGIAIDDSYITAANICDELVQTPDGEEKRYRCSYVFAADESPRTVLTKIRATCDGLSLSVAGRHAIQVGAYYGPGTITLTEDDIVGDITITPDVRRRDLVNTVSATYTDPDSNWNEVDMPRVVHDGYVARDGYEVVDDLDLIAVPSVFQAQRLALIHILTTRNAINIEMTCSLKATPLLPGAVFRLKMSENRWDDIEFMVTDWKYSSKGNIRLSARQTLESHYTFDGNTAKVPVRPGSTTRIDRSVTTVTDLSYTTLSDSNTLQAVITWNHLNYGGTTYELSFYKNGEFLRKDTTVDKQYRLHDGFTVGQYEVQVVAVSYSRRSAIASLVFNATAPSTPIGCDVVAGNWNLQLTPTPASVVNFDTMYDFALGFESGATDSDVESFIIGRAKVITVSNLKADTEYQIAIREVSRWGTSDWYRTSAKTTFNSADVLEVISGQISQDDLNEDLNGVLTEIEARSNAMADDQDARLNALLSAIDDFHQENSIQTQNMGLAYAEQKLVQQADEISAQAANLLDLLAKYNDNTAYITQLQQSVANANTALTESKEQLLAQIADTLSRANEYTRASVGYCIDANGNVTTENDAVACVAAGHSWVDGPLAEFIRNLQVTNGSGETASVSQLMQVFENVDGNLVARGGLTVNNQGRVTGMVSTNDGETTSLDLIAQHLRIGDQDTAGAFTPTLYVDSDSKKLVLNGRLILDDGQEITSRGDLQGTSWASLTLRDGIFPSDSLASADFLSRYGRAPSLDDMLTYVSNDGSVSSTKSFDGTNWVAPAAFINGNLITTGSVYGDAFVAGSEITSPVLKGGIGYFGADADAPYDGYHTRISADGQIDTDKLNASGGEFENIIIHENCRVMGTLSAGQIIGDIARPQVVNVATNKTAGISPGSTRYINLVTNLDLGSVSWSRKLILPAGISFDDTAVSYDALEILINGTVVLTYDHTKNTYRGQTGTGSLGYSFYTLAAEVYLAASTNISLSIRKKTRMPSGTRTSATSYVFPQGFVLWITKA